MDQHMPVSKSSRPNNNLQLYNVDYYLAKSYAGGVFEKQLNKLKDLRQFYLTSSYNVLFTTYDHKTFSFGQNLYGLCGVGKERGIVAEMTEVVELRGEELVDVQSSGNHILVRSASNKIFGWGRNVSKEIDDSEKTTHERPVLLYENAEDIKMFTCRDSVTVVLKSGQLIVRGTTNGTYFLPPSNADPKNNQIVYFTCGNDHAFVVSVDGEVFSFGPNGLGKLSGKISFPSIFTPLVIGESAARPLKIDSVVCGNNHTLVLNNEGDLHAFGSNQNYQLGFINKYTKKPRKVWVNNEIIQEIDTLVNVNGSLAQSITGECFVWGEILYGSRGTAHRQPFDHYEPVLTPFTSIKEAKVFHDNLSIPFLKDRYPQSNEVFQYIMAMFNNKKMSDIEFVLGSRVIYLHRFILRVSSDYMKRMLETEWIDKKQIVISGYKHRVCYAYLYFLYSERILPRLKLDHIAELIKLSHDYGEETLIKACSELISSTMINLANVCQVYILGVQFKLDSLKEKAAHFFRANISQIAGQPDFQNLDAEYIKQIMLSM